MATTKPRPAISDTEVTRIERMFTVARRVKDISQSIVDYEAMHAKRIASMKAASWKHSSRSRDSRKQQQRADASL
jgi:hypothetical protein